MPEPITTAVIVTAAISGAAAGFVKDIASKAPEWLISLVSAQSPAVQKKLNENLNNFVNRLAERVTRLEADIPAEKASVFEESMSDPSASLMMRKALLSGAVTDNDDRHAILSELIAQRLTADADDMIALAGGAASDVVSSLSSRHIHILGIMATLYKIRPLQPGKADSQEIYDKAIAGWWNGQLEQLCTDNAEKATGLDFDHLVGTGCIRLSIGGHNLKDVFSLKTEKGQYSITEEVLEQYPWWSTIHKLWGLGMSNASLTSIGSLIGVLYHDEVLKVRTNINWD